MFKNIAYTLGSRVLLALLSVAVLLLTTRFMDPAAKGEISLLVLNLSLASLLSGFLGGPALVYLTPRQKNQAMLVINTVYSLFAVGGLTALLDHYDLLGIDPVRFFRMAFAESFIATALMMLLGQNNIRWHNRVMVLKSLILVVLLMLWVPHARDHFHTFTDAYDWSLLASFCLSIGLLIYGMRKQHQLSFEGWSATVRAMWHYGFLVQSGNIAQLLNYRLSYYAMEFLIAPPQLALVRIGIYSAAVQVSEAVWQFTRSVSTVQYAEVSNMDSRPDALRLSLQLCKLNYTVSLAALVLLALIPAGIYDWIFGEGFEGLKWHFLLLSPGIFALAVKGAINHFYAGVGDHRYNTLTSVFGLLLTGTLLYPLITGLGSYGAAVVASAVYTIQLVMQYRFLSKTDKVRLGDFLLKSKDIAQFHQRITQWITSERS